MPASANDNLFLLRRQITMNTHSFFSASNSSSDCLVMPDSSKVYCGIYRMHPREIGLLIPRPVTPSLPESAFTPSSAPTSILSSTPTFRPMTPPIYNHY